MADFRSWRTTRRGSWSTTPTRTSWRRRTGCATTPTPACATASSRCATRAATSCARPATPPSSSATSTPPSTACGTATPATDYQARRGGRDHAAQELRGHRLVRRRGPPARARPARLRQPAGVQHVPQPPPARLGARRRPRARRRRRRAPTTAAWSSSARSTSACCRPATCPWPTSTGPARLAARGHRHGRGRPARRVGLPAGPLPQPRRPRPGLGRGQEAGIPVVFHVGGTGDLIDPAYFRNGLPIPPDFHGGEENFRSVDYMGIPGPPAQTLATMIFDGVLERFPDLRIGVIEQGAIWVPSWMRQMESAFEAFARHEERLQAPVAAPHRVRAPPGPLHALPHRGRGLDHRPVRARGVPVLVRLPPRRGRPAAHRALRGVARPASRDAAPARPSTATTSSTSWAPG